MFYIHQTSCISPQQTFIDADINKLHEPFEKKLNAIEPSYNAIPPGILRRMGKVVRMGVGAAMPLLQKEIKPDGIIMATANGGKDDCVKFLYQIIEYDEGLLTPMNFVQGTPNAVAAQIGLLTKNHGYNITHLHVGLAFEYALIDADMMLIENPLNNYLLGSLSCNSAKLSGIKFAPQFIANHGVRIIICTCEYGAADRNIFIRNFCIVRNNRSIVYSIDGKY